MGQGHTAVNQWMEHRERFADFFNGTVFCGEQVVLPEDLEPAKGETDFLVTDKEGETREIRRYRDIVMKWKRGPVLILLACENQANIHYAMSVRNMLYDSLSYVQQIQLMWKESRKEEKEAEENQQISSAEFLSKFRKEDRLFPVITLVFYYGSETWDGSTDLHGILQWSEDEKENQLLKKYVSNYRMNLVDAGNVEHLEHFKTDLQEILGMIQYRTDKENLLKYINDRKTYFQNVDEETYYAIREFLHSEKILKETVEKKQSKESVDMCKALEDLYNDGIEQGIERGKVQGMVETMKDLGVEKETAIQRIVWKLSFSQEQAEKVVEEYWCNSVETIKKSL